MPDATLSPRQLLDVLEPTLRLDDPVVDDYVLADCYRLDDRDPVIVELRRGPRDAVELSVEPLERSEIREPPASVAGLGISYRGSPPGELGLAACRALAARLQPTLGEAPRRWTMAPFSMAGLAAPVAAELRCEPATLDLERDRAVLTKDFDHYEYIYGVRPEVLQVYVQDEPVPGVSVHYPAPQNGRVPNSASVYPITPRVAHRRRMRHYFGRLGYAFDEQGYARIVPTPRTFNRALAPIPGRARLRPRMIAGIAGALRPIYWGMIVRRNLLPVSVAPRWVVEFHRHVRDVPLLETIPCDVGMIVHDMGLHAMAIHAMPEAAWDEFVDIAFSRVRARPWSILYGRLGVLGKLAGFVEGSLTQRCWDAWREADEPEDFEACFARQYDALVRELRGL